MDIYTAPIATFVSVIFIWLSALFTDYARQILSTEVVLLPIIYILGNRISTILMQNSHWAAMDRLNTISKSLNEKLVKAENTITMMKRENKNMRGNDGK